MAADSEHLQANRVRRSSSFSSSAYEFVYGWIDGWLDGCMDGWMDEGLDGCRSMCVCKYSQDLQSMHIACERMCCM
jgi:hypothetical protein